MDKRIMALLALISVVLLAGCSGNQVSSAGSGNAGAEATGAGSEKAAAQNTGAGAAGSTAAKLAMDKIYRYDMAKSYAYRMTSSSGGQTTTVNMKYSTSSDSADGTSAWLTTSEMDTSGAKVISKMWLDKITYKCLKISTTMEFNGQKIDQPAECPKEGPNSAARTDSKIPEYDYKGKESVTVPAGTYSCDKYSGESVTFWINKDVPVPVKVEYSSGSTKMELVSFS